MITPVRSSSVKCAAPRRGILTHTWQAGLPAMGEHPGSGRKAAPTQDVGHPELQEPCPLSKFPLLQSRIFQEARSGDAGHDRPGDQRSQGFQRPVVHVYFGFRSSTLPGVWRGYPQFVRGSASTRPWAGLVQRSPAGRGFQSSVALHDEGLELLLNRRSPGVLCAAKERAFCGTGWRSNSVRGPHDREKPACVPSVRVLSCEGQT